MRKNKLWSILMMLILVLGTALTFSSCSSGDDDDDRQKGNDETTQKKDEGKDETDNQKESVWGKGTWYFKNSEIQWSPLKKSEFDGLEKLIADDDALYQQYGCDDYKWWMNVDRERITREFHIDKYTGRFWINDFYGANAVRIVDDGTIVLCYLELYVDEDYDPYENLRKVVTLFRGKIYKSVSLYIHEEYRTYVKQGNKLILTNGDVFTDTGNGLILDGESEVRVAKDPAKLFEVK